MDIIYSKSNAMSGRIPYQMNETSALFCSFSSICIINTAYGISSLFKVDTMQPKPSGPWINMTLQNFERFFCLFQDLECVRRECASRNEYECKMIRQ